MKRSERVADTWCQLPAQRKDEKLGGTIGRTSAWIASVVRLFATILETVAVIAEIVFSIKTLQLAVVVA